MFTLDVYYPEEIAPSCFRPPTRLDPYHCIVPFKQCTSTAGSHQYFASNQPKSNMNKLLFPSQDKFSSHLSDNHRPSPSHSNISRRVPSWLGKTPMINLITPPLPPSFSPSACNPEKTGQSYTRKHTIYHQVHKYTSQSRTAPDPNSTRYDGCPESSSPSTHSLFEPFGRKETSVNPISIGGSDSSSSRCGCSCDS